MRWEKMYKDLEDGLWAAALAGGPWPFLGFNCIFPSPMLY
ncbi:hypothetical protein CLOSTASPAR_02021 [[Clostridium] asparagiforme DSM 15981]|uniref:Uncharacterized protein n=1 Tax=[Clostridium] asparagiforme DSM 15981 TaxID=518636 RepID=C0CYE5_9FIRM|nr:hypothetical protein CLOSTASPAR_02021 [[Clostridium] asparagiforme DSM 15981]